MDHHDAAPDKKRYKRPELREYGDLRHLTENDFGSKGMPDGASYGKANLKSFG